MEKTDIALQQLIDAVHLYEKGHYISALTLYPYGEPHLYFLL